MKKRGFTLIELLAVITILAIILLIAVLIVLKLTKDSKESTAKESLELYGRAIEQAVANYFMNNPEEDDISIGILESQGLIQYKGTKVKCDEVLIRDKQVYMEGCKVGEQYIEETYGEFIPMGTLVIDADNDGEISVGDKYKYKVNSNDEFNFYVLSIEEDKVNLIMDRNICEDGNINYNEENNYCRYAWHEGENTNEYGPDTAMTTLYNATKNWYNVPNMNLEYDDIQDNIDSGYTGDTTYGYKGISIKNGIGNIIAKDNTVLNIELDNNKTIKARLPKLKEVTDVGCYRYDVEDENFPSSELAKCPAWLVENLMNRNYNGNNNYYLINSQNVEGTALYRIDGYYLLSSYPNYDKCGRRLRSFGYVGYITGEFGVRPVITVSKADLSN